MDLKIRFVFDGKQDKMEWLPVEITVHRVGGPDRSPESPIGAGYPWERTYGPRIHNLAAQPGGNAQSLDLQGAHVPPDRMVLRFYRLEQTEHGGWYGGELHLSNAYDSPIGGPRPFLYYGAPSDVPMHTHCYSPHYGHYVVAMRCPSTRPTTPAPDGITPCPEGCMVCRPDRFADQTPEGDQS